MHLARCASTAGAAVFLALSAQALDVGVGGVCSEDTECISGCCATEVFPSPRCVDTLDRGPGERCQTLDGCDCTFEKCIDKVCPVAASPPQTADTGCDADGLACRSGCCATMLDTPICIDKGTQYPGESCTTEDGCDCVYGRCIDGVCPDCLDDAHCPDGTECCDDGTCSENCACPSGTVVCGDPHMQGLRGQAIDWSGVDGGWYCLVTDDEANFHMNVRLTAPLPDEFPDRQLITGISVISGGHSLAVEVTNPYDVDTSGCPAGVSPCLAHGGLRAIVDGEEVDGLLRSTRNKFVTDGITVSASNLPVECRQFGGDKIWARMYGEMLQGSRQLDIEESFEDWILRFDSMAAHDWCTQYVAQHDLAELQSNHAIFKIVTSAVTVRLNVGTNYQGNGDLDWDGRVLPDLEFWQMDVGVHGLSLDNESLSGILGETARPVVDKAGHKVMKGYEAFRGTVEDYRVSGSLGTDFAFLSKKESGVHHTTQHAEG